MWSETLSAASPCFSQSVSPRASEHVRLLFTYCMRSSNLTLLPRPPWISWKRWSAREAEILLGFMGGLKGTTTESLSDARTPSASGAQRHVRTSGSSAESLEEEIKRDGAAAAHLLPSKPARA